MKAAWFGKARSALIVARRRGGSPFGVLKSKALVRSPQTVRRQALMLGSWTPNLASRKRITEVWSKTSEHTQPPRLQGEMTNIGTRMPRP